MNTAPRTTGFALAKVATLLVTLLVVAACGGGDANASDPADNAGSEAPAGLTPEQLENGIGPITSLDLEPIDPALVEAGLETYTLKCSACHKMDERYVGPALRDVTERRMRQGFPPEEIAYVMNTFSRICVETVTKDPRSAGLEEST